jgi:hypothetical protein
VLERLASNQRRAEALGWSEFVLERTGGSGRLVLRGTPPIGPDRALVPDAIPYRWHRAGRCVERREGVAP